MDKQTKRNIYIFAVISCLYIANSLILRFLYVDDEMFLNSFGAKFDLEKAQEILRFDKNWVYIKFLFTPIAFFVRATIVVFIFFLGLYLNEVKTSVKDLYRIAILGEITFLLFTSIRTGLVFNHEFSSLAEIGNYAPFRFIPLEKISDYPVWLKIPMSVINPIEILYWIVLAFLLSKQMTWNYLKSLLFVIKTYVVGLFIWIVFLIFVKVILIN